MSAGRLRLTLLPLLSAAAGLAQNAGPGRGAARGGPLGAYPARPKPDAAVVERGKGLYSVNCAFCHGSDARGGEGGPNLLRSSVVLGDKNGEQLGVVVHAGRPDAGMPGFPNLSDSQIGDLAAFLHSFPVGGRDPGLGRPETIVVGNAESGKKVFEARCASCHSVTADLKGIASRIADPKDLQQTWLMPSSGGGRGRAAVVQVRPVTVTVTLADGSKAEGSLQRLDDFAVTLRDASGNLKSFPRRGSRPGVQVHNPLQPHLDLLPKYTDPEIHDLTAYLVTLK